VRVAFWASSEDGSSWYRCDQPANALRWLGHHVWASKVLPASVKANSDVIVGSRVAGEGQTQAWRDLKARGKRLVMDFDDDYWHLQRDNRQAFEFWQRPGLLDRMAENVAICDRVTCVSEPLADVLRQWNPDVVVIPNGLHAALLSAPRRYDDPTIRVGWAGTASTITELHLAARALNRILDYTPPAGGRVEAGYIGATPESLARAGITPHPRARSVEWIDGNDTYLRAVAGFDIWVAPYRDTAFTRAKFPTKALEAGFLGIPLVASAIRPYTDWIEHGVDGFLVEHEHQWSAHLKRLVDDPALRARVGAAARSKASRYVLQDLGRRWEEALS
jgi:glycosyltransferase involved in cell wall biosynthesis